MLKNIKILLCTILLFVAGCATKTNVIEEDNIVEETSKITISDGYVLFGAYPQSEVVSMASESGVYGKAWQNDDDYIVDEDLYNTLEELNEDEWDDNNDAIVDGEKYRRIKADDATYATSGDANYYDWSNNIYHYFKYEPIKWIILEENDDELFLLSELILDDQMYNTEIKNITWSDCTLRSWLNGYDSTYNSYGTDYSNNNFIDTAFSTDEQDLIISSTVKNEDNLKNGTEAGDDTNDKIFILSEVEVYGDEATKYGFESDHNADDVMRQAKSSTYAKAMGTYVDLDNLGNCFWWLRTPGSHPGLFILVRCDGSVYRGGQHANSKSRGVRLAMRITRD